jgi:hypothetical protein
MRPPQRTCPVGLSIPIVQNAELGWDVRKNRAAKINHLGRMVEPVHSTAYLTAAFLFAAHLAFIISDSFFLTRGLST